MNKILNALLIICVVILAGCVETKDEYTINPDGSGKVIHEVTMQSMDIGGMLGGMGGTMSMEVGEGPRFEKDSSSFRITEGGPAAGMFGNTKSSDPQAQLKTQVKEILDSSEGIDTWKDVSYELLPDGRMHFKGTAYFPDINKLYLESGGFSDDNVLTFTKDRYGRIVIELKKQEQDEESGELTPSPPRMTEAEVAAKVQEARAGYGQAKMMMASFLSSMKIETILHLPGRIVEISNFEQVDDNTARLAFDGPKMLEVMDKMMQDEVLLAEQIRSGRDPQEGPADELAFNELMFGQKGPLRIVAESPRLLPLFDYDAEVTAAKANYESMITDLGLEGVRSGVSGWDDVRGGGAEVPKSMVQGRISGTDVVLENASFDGNLSIYAGEDGWAFNPSLMIFLFLEEGTIPEGRSFSVTPSTQSRTTEPHIHYRWKNAVSGKIENDVVVGGYLLDLNFSQVVNGILPGRILFEIPGKDTRVEGYFNVKVEVPRGAMVGEPGITLPSGGDEPLFGVTFGDTSLSPIASERSAEDMKVKVGGMRLVRYSDFDLGIMPLGQNNGYTLSLIVELPEPVVKVSGGMVEKAVTDGGGDILPKQQWDREIRFAKLSKDKKIAVFDIDLLLPPEGTTVIEELSGTLEYLTATGSKQVDLGAMDFKAGTKVSRMGAEITAVEADPFQKNATMLSLRLNLAPEEIESVEFYARDGSKMDVSRRGYMSMGGTTTLDFSIKSELPNTGRIVVVVYDQLRKTQMPFRITKILLSGQPVW